MVHIQVSWAFIIPAEDEAYDTDIKRLIAGFEHFTSHTATCTLLTGVLSPTDRRLQKDRSYEAMENEISELIKRGGFGVVMQEEYPHAIMMWGRLVMSIEHHGANDKFYKAWIAIQGHTDSEKPMIIHNSPSICPHSMSF